MSTESTVTEVISAAGQDPFTLSALVILVLAAIARAWFNRAPVPVRERVFYVLVTVAIGFGGIGIARVWPTQNVPTLATTEAPKIRAAQASTATPQPASSETSAPPASPPSAQQPSASTSPAEPPCPGGMPRFADGTRECLPIPGALFVSQEVKVKLRDRCRLLAAQGFAHDGYTSTNRCFDHGAG